MHDQPRNATDLLNQFFSDPGNLSTKLDLSNCGLSELPSLFDSLIEKYPTASERLALLNLAHNKLQTLPWFLTKLPNLRILFLLRNDFRSIPSVISKLQSVTMLSFKENQLQGELSGSSLPPNISWLIMTSNKLTGLSDDFGSRCHRVRKLMLSNNLLSSLPRNLSSEMPHLELLRLANNQFEKFPRDVLQFPRIAWLAMSGNPCLIDNNGDSDQSLPGDLRIGDLDGEFDVQWDKAPLGSGASGTAYAATHRESGTSVVVKHFRAITGSDGRALDEVELSCAAVGVPHLVNSLGYYISDQKQMYLVTKRVEGNPKSLAGPPSFDSCVRSVYPSDLTMSMEDKKRVIQCIEIAVKGLLDRGVCHGDVYAHNVLISDEGAMEATLADLGAAWKIPAELKHEVVTMEMRALDIFRNEVLNLEETPTLLNQSN